MLAVLWIWLLVSYTSVGDWLFGEFFGLSDHVRDAAKYALLVSIWVPIITVWRFLAYALLMVEKNRLGHRRYSHSARRVGVNSRHRDTRL